MIRKFLQKVDMYGQPVHLKINGQSTHQTEVGGLASIATITIVFFFFSSNILSFINRGNLSAIVVNDFEEIPEFTNLNGIMKLAVGFTNQTTWQYNITLQQIIIENQVIVNTIDLMMEQCTDTYFNSMFRCLKSNQDFLLGQIDNKKYEIHIKVTKCASCDPDLVTQQVQLVFLNQVINPMDRSENQIKTFLDDTYSIKFTPNTFSKEQELILTQYDLNNDDSLFYTDFHVSKAYVVDQRDCRQTVNADQDTYASFIFKKNRVKVTINRSYQKITDLLSRLGGFIEITFFILGFAFQIYNRLQLYLLLANKVYEFQFTSTKERNTHEQQFEVLNTVLQNKITKPMIQINDEGSQQGLPISKIGQKKNSICLRQRSSNQNNFSSLLHQIPLTTNETKKQPTEEEDIILSDYVLDNHESLAKKFNCESGLEYFQKQISIIINRSKPLQLTLKIFLNQVCCSRLFKSNVHVTLYQKSINEIRERLDVFYILQKLEELNKLKSILLTPQQLCVFNFTPKKLIVPDYNELRFSRHILEERARNRYNLTFINSEQNIQTPKRSRKSQECENMIYERIYNAYDVILKQSEGEHEQQKSDVNKQIINKLGVELQTIFKVSKLIDFSQLQNRSSRKIIRRNAQTNNEIQTAKMMQQFYQL